jgi:hypothetical protein
MTQLVLTRPAAPAAAAHAAGRWGPLQTIFAPDPENWKLADVVLTPGGDSLARIGSYSESRLRLAASHDHGPFDERRFFTEGRPGLYNDGRGGILAIGIEQSGRISARAGSVDGRFGPRQTIAYEPETLLDAFEYAVSPRGDVFLIWATSSDTCACLSRLKASVRPAGKEEFGPVQVLSPRNRSSYNPQMVFDRHGNALLAWEQEHDVNRGRLAYALHPAGAGEFGPTRTLHAAGNHGAAFGLHLAANPGGRAVAVWSARAEPLRDVRAAFGTVAAGLHSIQRVANGRTDEAHVALDRGGEAVVAWGGRRPTLAIAPPGERFGRPRALERGRATGPVVVDDGAGTFTLSWRAMPRRALHVARLKVGSATARVAELAPGRVWRATLAATAAHETLIAWNLIESNTPKRGTDPQLSAANVAVAPPGDPFGTPLRLTPGPSGTAFPNSRVEIKTDAVGGALVWWEGDVDGAPGTFGRFRLPR